MDDNIDSYEIPIDSECIDRDYDDVDIQYRQEDEGYSDDSSECNIEFE